MFSFLKKTSTRDATSSPVGTPKAPKLTTKKLPDVGSSAPVIPLVLPPRSASRTEIAQPKPIRAHRPRIPSLDSGYSTSPEPLSIARSASTAARRRPSDASTSSIGAEGPPSASRLKGILKKETPLAGPQPRRLHEVDGYASSPEKPSRYPSAPPRHVPRQPKQPSPLGNTPPVSLHWKLLPYNHNISKARVLFDITQRVEDIRLLYTYPPRPLTTTERIKPAANPALHDMVIRCDELPEWPIYVASPAGIRCIDVFEAICETMNLVLTTTEKRAHASQVQAGQRYFEERCRKSQSEIERDKGMRRVDLLYGKTWFQGLDWTPPDKANPDGSWRLKLGYPITHGR